MIELTYIQSTGTQYIDTGIPSNTTDLRIEFTYSVPSFNPVSGIIGSSWGLYGFFLATLSPENKLRWHSGGKSVDFSITLNEFINFKCERTQITVDGVVYALANPGNNDGNNMQLFFSGTGYSRNQGKMGRVKVYTGETLLKDYIPCRDEEDVVCMYDNVAGSYVYNDGTGSFVGGDPVLPSYIVAFNANGGTGTMASQSIIVDEPTALTLNAFTRDDYAFSGWATTPAGPVVYTDGEVVTNLTTADQTVTLYAVWRPAPMTLLLQTNTSEPIKVDKDVETIASVYATLREECSIIDPVFNVQMDIADAVRCNYVTVPKFGRSYFVQEVVSVRTGLVQLSCHVDVLSSFKSQIRANSAIVHKQEGEWNLYLNDGSLRIYQDPIVITRPFPSGFSRYEYVMAIAGN